MNNKNLAFEIIGSELEDSEKIDELAQLGYDLEEMFFLVMEFNDIKKEK